MGGTNSISLDAFNITSNLTINLNEYKCSDRGLILPIINEYTWPVWLRGILYFVFLLYLFLGIALIADIFMKSIEVITNKTYTTDDGSKVKIWDETVACLTLIALGSSSPEILLSIIEIVGNNFNSGELGPGTIVGSAAYNLMFISAVCVIAVGEEGTRIKDFYVFLTTTIYSIIAYIWLFIVLSVWTPDEVTIWEALITLLAFPLLVVNSYLVRKFFKSEDDNDQGDEEQGAKESFELYSNQTVNAKNVLHFYKAISKQADLSEDDIANLLAAKMLNSKQKNVIDYYNQGVSEMTGGSNQKIKLEPRLQKIMKYLDLYDEQDDEEHASDKDTEDSVEFSASSYAVLENENASSIMIRRNGGTDKEVKFRVISIDGTAKAGQDFSRIDEEITMKRGQTLISLNCNIIDDSDPEHDEKFFLKLSNKLANGYQTDAKINKKKSVCVVTIIDNDNMVELVNEKLKSFDEFKNNWSNQFKNALTVKDGDIDSAIWPKDYILHMLSLPWKFLFAFVPPAHFLGGWLCFFVSLFLIGLMTAIVGDAAAIFGCIVGLKDAVTAITFVALGTSLPDTFASFIAAKQEKTADNAIGNVTGSNSVNIFLGLGLPWTIASIYWKIKGQPFVVKAGSLAFSVGVYTLLSSVVFAVLFIRRFVPYIGNELGGNSLIKWLTFGLFISLWIIYILLSSLQAYDIIRF